MRKIIVVALLSVLTIGAVSADQNPPTMQVRGDAVLQVAADQAQISLSVENSEPDVDKALAANSEQLTAVMAALRRHGVSDDEMSTRGLNVTPQWTPRPRQADDQWQPRIVGYRVQNQLQLTTQQLEKLGVWIQAAVEAGANRIGQLQFSLADPRLHYHRALSQATDDAKHQASVVAEAAGVQLSTIDQILVESAQPMPQQHMRLDAMAMSASVAPPPVTPGDVEVRAAVSLRYRIMQ